jgi:hypothetical protein
MRQKLAVRDAGRGGGGTTRDREHKEPGVYKSQRDPDIEEGQSTERRRVSRSMEHRESRQGAGFDFNF